MYFYSWHRYGLGLAAIMAAFAFASCQPDKSGGLRFASDIPQAQRTLIEKDFALLPQYAMAKANAAFINDFGFDGQNGTELSAWIHRRLHVIVGENLDDQAYRYREGATYPATPLPILEKERPDWSLEHACREIIKKPELWDKTFGADGDGPHGTMVMANIGTEAYLLGKENDFAIKIKVPGVGAIAVDSPRAGIAQIGEGLFWNDLENADTVIDRMYRLSTYAHEARHSDGHGPSLGFLHAVCPKQNDLAGELACDSMTNGAYAIGGELLQQFAESCGEAAPCQVGTREREVLRILYLDAFSRVLTERPTIAECADPATLSVANQKVKDEAKIFMSTPRQGVAREEGVNRCTKLTQTIDEAEALTAQCPVEIQKAQAVDAAPETRIH